MNTIGFFKFHRELFGKSIWEDSTPEQKVILITLLGMANYEKNTWEYKGDTYTVNAGEFITSIPTIIDNCGKGITEKKVRVALKRFEELGFLKDEILVRNKSRKITIVNWGKYQFKNDEKRADVLADSVADKRADIKTDKTIDNKGFISNKKNKRADVLTDGVADSVHPIKEKKEIKNNNIPIQQAEQFNLWWDLYGKKADRKKCEIKFNQLLKKYNYPQIEEGTKRYLNYRANLKARGEFVPDQKYPLTFLNGENFNDEYETGTKSGFTTSEPIRERTIQQYNGPYLD